ncbi:MAG: response regulator [Burkholderiales bacterium]
MSDLTVSRQRIAAQSEFRVLVVDDDQDMAGFLAHMLRREGMEADTAADGRAALARIVASPPDLVMLDVLMPGPSGFEVCRRLKADPSTALIPIVLITALDDSESRVRGIEAGADDFLSKPVNREELLARVKTLRKLHETRRELKQRRLAAEIERKETIRKAFSRYISPSLAERIIQDLGASEGPFRANAQRIEVVALFADLRGFTRITEHTEVGDVVEMLNEYFAILTEAAYQQDGTIFNMAGDSLLIGFNVPLPQKDAAARALQCAREMVARFAPVGRQWERRFGIATGVGIGICKGEAIIGNIGSPHYMSYTIIGNPVNTAARLMQMAAANEVLVCGSFYESVRELVSEQDVRSRGNVALRGKSAQTPVLCIAGSRPDV